MNQQNNNKRQNNFASLVPATWVFFAILFLAIGIYANFINKKSQGVASVQRESFNPDVESNIDMTVEISENGYVNWIKIPKTERIHVIINEGKLVSVRPL